MQGRNTEYFCAWRRELSWGWVLGFFLSVFCPGQLLSQSDLSNDDLIVQWVLEFADRTEWPAGVEPSSGQPLILGLVGSFDRSHPLFALDRQKTEKGRRISIQLFSDIKDRKAIGNCHLVYLHRRFRARYARLLLKELEDTNTMIFCDRVEYFERGPVVCFDTRRKGNVGLNVDFEVIRRQKLNVDPTLLAALKRVSGR